MVSETKEATLVFSLEAYNGPQQKEGNPEGNRHITDMKRQILEFREDEVAGICETEKQHRERARGIR